MSMSVMKKVALGVPVLMVLAQAPMTHLPSGTGISPLQVIARFLLDARDKPAEQRPSDWLVVREKPPQPPPDSHPFGARIRRGGR